MDNVPVPAVSGGGGGGGSVKPGTRSPCRLITPPDTNLVYCFALFAVFYCSVRGMEPFVIALTGS